MAALRSVFGAACPVIPSTTSATGHLLGAAGALEAIITALALRDGIVSPTLNPTAPDEAAVGMDRVEATAKRSPVECVLSNGFGGVNASIILKRVSAGHDARSMLTKERRFQASGILIDVGAGCK